MKVWGRTDEEDGKDEKKKNEEEEEEEEENWKRLDLEDEICKIYLQSHLRKHKV